MKVEPTLSVAVRWMSQSEEMELMTDKKTGSQNDGTPPTDQWKRDRGGSLAGRVAPSKTGRIPESELIDGPQSPGPDDGSNSNT